MFKLYLFSILMGVHPIIYNVESTDLKKLLSFGFIFIINHMPNNMNNFHFLFLEKVEYGLMNGQILGLYYRVSKDAQ